MSEDELTKLRGVNAGLTKQVQRLIQAELRFNRATHALERQMARSGVLSRFALEAGDEPGETELLSRALQMVLAMYPYEQGVAFCVGDGTRVVPVTVASVEGLESDSRRNIAENAGPGVPVESIPDAPVLLGPGAPAEQLSELSQLLACGERIFGEEGHSVVAGSVLIIPLHPTATKPMAVLLRRMVHVRSHVDRLPTDADRPFLKLVATHIESALRNAERGRMRAQLEQADRLATVGQLAAGVAHEINNPLTYVISSAERIAEQIPGDSTLGRAAATVLDGVHRIRDITRDLKTFTKVDEEASTAVLIEPVLAHVLQMADGEIRYRATAETEFSSGLAVLVSEGRLAQVFLNLVINAAHAIDEGDVDGNWIRVTTAGTKDEVRIEIADSGRGMSPETLVRAFEPFVSESPDSQGTGLGLSICRNIVEGYGGRIEVESEGGRGSKFTVWFPRVESAANPESERVRPQRASTSTSSVRVLVVDDEPLITDLLRAALEDEYSVDIAVGAGEALEQIRGADYGVIICDLMMPGMSGMELYEAMRESHPDLATRMVFMTGGTFTPRAAEFVSQHRDRVLDKPFEFDALYKLLARVICGT